MSKYSIHDFEDAMSRGDVEKLRAIAEDKKLPASQPVNPLTKKKLDPVPLDSQVSSPVPSKQSTHTGPSKYDGDFAESEPKPVGGYEAMAFKSPAHVLAFFNEDIQSGVVSLHKWQAEVCKDLAPEVKPSSLHPLKYFLVAANGSGKDAFVIAPFAIWFVLCKVEARVIITSSSGTQLTAQTELYIRQLAEKVNNKLGQPIFKIRQRYIRCNTTGSEIRMFATDEAGKAEGYHPMNPNCEMAIIKNESKSISEDIHKALKRCSGFNYWLEVSSTGAPRGAFHRAATRWPNGRRITSLECPHISDEEREEDKVDLGEGSAEYRSKHLALFTSVDGECVIPSAIHEVCLNAPPSIDFPSWPKRVGIDLAAGCDENCITIVKGTRVLKEYAFAEKDTTVATTRIDRFLVDNSILKDSEFIYADDGGVGHAIIDNLCKLGWRINRIHNQGAAYNKRQYGNKGAELWFRVKRIVEEKMIDIRALSEKTHDQLINRRYKQPAGGRLFLQPKKEAKAEGFNSPDRADAFILSLTGLTIADFLDEKKVKDVETKPTRKRLNSSDEVQTYYEGVTFQEYEMIQGTPSSGKKIRNSLTMALGLGSETVEESKFNYDN